MLRTLIENLTRNQKIGILVFLQIMVIIILVLVVQTFTAEKTHVEIEKPEESSIESDMPENVEKYVEDNIWEVIKSKVVGADKNDVDVVIREGTYSEVKNDDGVQATFIVDIDSMKQSFVVRTGWSKDKKTVYEVIVDCPKAEEMKYPDTVCYGSYNSSYSLDLYLPHMSYPDTGKDGSDSIAAPNYIIYGNEDDKTLEIVVSSCDVEKFKKEAWDYLNTIPIDFSSFTVTYEVNNTDVRC